MSRRKKYVFARGTTHRAATRRKLSLYIAGHSLGWPPGTGRKGTGQAPTFGIGGTIGQRSFYAAIWRRTQAS